MFDSSRTASLIELTASANVMAAYERKPRVDKCFSNHDVDWIGADRLSHTTVTVPTHAGKDLVVVKRSEPKGEMLDGCVPLIVNIKGATTARTPNA